ncbi:MAG: hypothetical protein JNM27_11240 [Leptospirales bacterium]|nr:hypothetical protein [Leptospirales bacterium]
MRTLRLLLVLIFVSPLVANPKPAGFFLLPAEENPALLQLLQSPVIDKELLLTQADAAERSTRAELTRRQNLLRAEICSAALPARKQTLEQATKQLTSEHTLYTHQLGFYEAHIFRRMETEIEEAYRERAVEARKTAFVMQRERQDLVRKSWARLLSENLCDRERESGLFPERLMAPYFLALWKYQAIFPAEMRSRSLLLVKTGR